MRVTRSLLALLVAFSAWTCDKATPVAPSDGTLQISANPTKIDVFGTAVITVIGRKADGNPVNEGTEVNFSTTAGRIEPSVARANDRGVAEAVLTGLGAVDVATVTASSGGAAPVTVDVEIGSLAASITLQATPARVKRGGDTLRLVATVRDEDGNPILRALVTFETEAGRLRSQGAAVETDQQGKAEDQLTVNQRDIERLESSSILVSASVSTTGGALLFADEEITVAGVPFEILLSPNPATVPEEGGQIVLTALVTDDRGRGVQGEAVLFGTDLGSLRSRGAQVTTNNRGEAVDVLTVTLNDLGTLDPGASFDVSARTPRLAEEVTESIQVTGEPDDPAGAPARLFLDASPQIIDESGATVTLSALVLDVEGEPVVDTNVVFISDEAGSLASGGQLVKTDVTGTAFDALTLTAQDLEAVTGSSIDVSATAPAGSNVTDTETIDIRVAVPRASFTFTKSGNTVQFTDTSTGRGLRWSWVFGDAANPGTNTSSLQNPSHTYPGPGTYTVTLTVSNSAGSDTATRDVTLP